LYGDEQNST